ncbi:MAG: HEAT repeat domain-containing protein [Prevotellaceae bacterium]|jgi:hypothetical protein|nr:HEAT repeat domain-containing protein [Prevotellaceae bacterium]
MKIQALYDLQQETNRLFIAGSKFSKGDPRIQKFIPVFNKLGEKAPVFKKIASDLEELLDADIQQSAEKLTAISTLLYSVLYTQGETVEADVEEKIQQPTVDINNVNTNHSYMQLKPVIEALTVSSSGRLEVLKDAFERKIFEDSRTFHYLVLALGDKYSELADYVEKTVIPFIGKPVVSFLIQNFTFEDRAENVRRLRLLNKLKYEKLQETVDKIMSLSCPNLQAEAVNILSDNIANEQLIIELADDKNKQVREAAYQALAKMNTRNSLEKLKDVYIKNKNKTSLPAIACALASTRLPFFFPEVFNQIIRTLDEFVSLEKDADNKQFIDKFNKLSIEIGILANKNNEQIIEFFDKIFNGKKFSEILSSRKNASSYNIDSLTDAISASLDSFDNEKVLNFYTHSRLEMPDAAWKEVFCRKFLHKASENGYSKEKIYDLFAPAFDKKIIHAGDLHFLLSGNQLCQRWIPKIYEIFKGNIKWDYRFDCALEIIDACEPDRCEKFDELMVYLTGKINPTEAIVLYKLMIKRKLPDCFETIYLMASKVRTGSYYYYHKLHESDLWKSFPKDYAPKFKELSEQTNMELFNIIVEKIQSAE